MAGLDHVQPGDLITSALLNAIIDALVKLDEKITKCCEAIDTLPKEPADTTPGETRPDEETSKMVIERIVPFDASPGDTVTITGAGFISDKTQTRVSIGGKLAKITGNVTTTQIEVVVPTFGFRKRSKVDVVVGDPTGVHATSEMTVGPLDKALKTGVALLDVTPAGTLTAGLKYIVEFIVGSTAKDNLKVTVVSLDPKSGKRTAQLASREFSFATKTTQKFEVAFALPKQGCVIEVSLSKGDKVVTSESYSFVAGQEPPVDINQDVFGAIERKG
jgi:IPT/TIG domain